MEKKIQCVTINKLPNGTGNVIFHQKDNEGKITAVFTYTYDKAAECDKFKHLAFYNTVEPTEAI